MWHLIFLFFTIINILSFIYPFLLEFDVRLNVLKLKGVISIIIFNKIKISFKFRIKNGYIYVYFKKKEKKEKLSSKNVNLLFIANLIHQLYFREQILSIEVASNFGYNLDACITASTSGALDVINKSILAKIKNNKKSAHIFTKVEPKYNEDIFNLRINNVIRISVADIIYSFIYTKIYQWRDYERSRKSKSK